MRLRAAAAAFAACLAGRAAAAGPRVYSLDQCADQYVLALSPRRDVEALSMRARNADSYLRAEARGAPLGRADAESVLAAHPDVVVRYWGGDARLVADLQRHGIRVLTIADAVDFTGVAEDVRVVAAGLDQTAQGERLIARMQRTLAASAGAGGGRGVYYLTSGGDTEGPGTLMDAMIRAAGFANLDRRPGWSVISPERLLLHPPALFVRGFFDAYVSGDERWSPARPGALARLAERRATVSLPGSILGCPAWFVADGAASLAAWARAHPAS